MYYSTFPIIIPDIPNTSFTEVILGVENEARAHGLWSQQLS
jgi:DNA-binding LacI/PurR family transcriptional regulator